MRWTAKRWDILGCTERGILLMWCRLVLPHQPLLRPNLGRGIRCREAHTQRDLEPVTRKGNIIMRGLGLMRHKGCSAQSGSLSLEQTQHGRKGHCHQLQASDELWFDGRYILFSVPYMVSVQFSSVTQSCPTLCDPMNRSMPGLPVHRHLPEFTETHIPSSR